MTDAEDAERLIARGEKGDQGAQGERGDRGLGPAVRRAVLFLFVFSVILSVGGLFWNAHQVNTSRAAYRHQSELAERKICTTLTSLAALQPPAGDPAANPSRAYLQGLHDRFTEISRDLGCQEGTQ